MGVFLLSKIFGHNETTRRFDESIDFGKVPRLLFLRPARRFQNHARSKTPIANPRRTVLPERRANDDDGLFFVPLSGLRCFF